MLGYLVEILRDESYAALVIAGDVYDRSIPSPEAVTLFGSFLADLKKARPDIEILVIPGNHDSPARLGFGRELFTALGIHFAAPEEGADRPVIAGKGKDSCAFFLLPFSGHYAAETAARLEEARLASGAAHSVLAAHLFAAGGSEAGSERVFLGNAEKTDPGFFSGFDYAALGHLHRFQRAGAKGWYSGSPLAYSFGEAHEKFVLSVVLDGDGPPRVDALPVKPLRRLSRLSGPFSRFLRPDPEDSEAAAVKNDYLEIVLSDGTFSENALALLRGNFPFLLSIDQEAAFAGLKERRPLGFPVSGERKDLESDFAEFLGFLYGEADTGKLALFRELAAEVREEPGR
jgi:exonuclease SbcD